MRVYGTNYYTAGRYGYTAIYRTHENSSGCNTVYTGIKPRKLAEAWCASLERCQAETLESFVMSVLSGGTANSETLYEYTVNIGDLYHEYLRPCFTRLKTILDRYYPHRMGDVAPYDLQGLYRAVCLAFEEGARLYQKEFPRGGQNEWYEITKLDIADCALSWIQRAIDEYRANKLAGYEADEASA